MRLASSKRVSRVLVGAVVAAALASNADAARLVRFETGPPAHTGPPVYLATSAFRL